ncbi:FAR-17a/AIG1-like protein [Thelephora terrestris]|uniref:FAR-17a/AIG1-like protein n=1 Tax=Thelephora terrestris TaxID=56493 RepID=A0A9P6H6R4_9AGAM|nr:FAR-17a/AIG1-like protein [Thelephora terrestris]
MIRQRLAAIVFHATTAYIMYWGFSTVDGGPVGEWMRSNKGQHSQFLTIQGLVVAWLTMVASLMVDIFPSNITLTGAKRWLLMISMPLEVTVSSIYWSLIILFPHLIMPAIPESSAAAAFLKLPLKVDLALHALPGIALAFDFFFFEKRYTKFQAARVAPLTAVLFGVWYVSWVEYCASHNERFPYPFLDSPYYIRAFIYVGAVLQAILSFRVLNSLHR